MELDVLFQYPEQISSAAEAITRGCREYIDLEKNSFNKETRVEIIDEQEYLEKKANDVESTGSDLKSSLKRFMFLSPRGKTRGPKTDPCRTPYVVKSLLTDEEKIAMRQRLNQESPI